jgi:hypothetical protein
MKKRGKRYSVINELFTVRNGDKTITFGLYSDHELFGEEVIPFAGTAQRSPDDKENYKRGMRVSVGAAYRNLGRQILKKEYDTMASQGLGVYTKQAAKEIVAGEKALESIEALFKRAEAMLTPKE